MERQQIEQDKCSGYSKGYLRELREKWLQSNKEEAQIDYFKAVREYNRLLVLEGEI